MAKQNGLRTGGTEAIIERIAMGWRSHSTKAPSRRLFQLSLATHRGVARIEPERPMTTVWIYVDASKEVGDPDHLKVFANIDAAETWFEEHDPEGVAFEYDVIETD